MEGHVQSYFIVYMYDILKGKEKSTLTVDYSPNIKIRCLIKKEKFGKQPSQNVSKSYSWFVPVLSNIFSLGTGEMAQ